MFALLARSKVHCYWSRRECANRAIIEAMMADVPVLVREGLTFGHQYPYINNLTGRFVPENELGGAILETIETRSRFAPRRWVLEHMTCVHGTRLLEQCLQEARRQDGSPGRAISQSISARSTPSATTILKIGRGSNPIINISRRRFARNDHEHSCSKRRHSRL